MQPTTIPENRDPFENQPWYRRLVYWILWGIAFALAYGPAPLFTSNQNQYFLHGLARAGWGDLAADWLANTLDPTPFFSGLVEWSYRLLSWVPIFYIYYAILAGIFFFSLIALVSAELRWVRRWRWVYAGLLLILFSGAVRVVMRRWLGDDWLYIFDGGLAGQRLLADIFQPSQFGVLLLLSILFFLRRHYAWTVLCLILAPSLHPTYLLSAAVLTLVYLGLLFGEVRHSQGLRRFRLPLAFGLVTLLGVTPILLHTFQTFVGGDPRTTLLARQILVETRIPHHALPQVWFNLASLAQIGFVFLGIYLARGTRLLPFLLWPTLVVALLSALQWWSGSDALALLFPWRLSTWLVPLAVALITGRALTAGLSWHQGWLARQAGWLRWVVLVGSLLMAAVGLAKTFLNDAAQQDVPQRAVIEYVRTHKTPGDVYLVDLKWQTFRLETGAPIYVDYKAIPYLAQDVLEWDRRVRRVSFFYRETQSVDCFDTVEEWALEGVTHLLMPVDHLAQHCPGLELRYQDQNYRLYQIRTTP